MKIELNISPAQRALISLFNKYNVPISENDIDMIILYIVDLLHVPYITDKTILTENNVPYILTYIPYIDLEENIISGLLELILKRRVTLTFVDEITFTTHRALDTISIHSFLFTDYIYKSTIVNNTLILSEKTNVYKKLYDKYERNSQYGIR